MIRDNQSYLIRERQVFDDLLRNQVEMDIFEEAEVGG